MLAGKAIQKDDPVVLTRPPSLPVMATFGTWFRSPYSCNGSLPRQRQIRVT